MTSYRCLEKTCISNILKRHGGISSETPDLRIVAQYKQNSVSVFHYKETWFELEAHFTGEPYAIVLCAQIPWRNFGQNSHTPPTTRVTLPINLTSRFALLSWLAGTRWNAEAAALCTLNFSLRPFNSRVLTSRLVSQSAHRPFIHQRRTANCDLPPLYTIK